MSVVRLVAVRESGLSAAELRRVAEEIAEKFQLHAVATVHRPGELAIGDLAAVILSFGA